MTGCSDDAPVEPSEPAAVEGPAPAVVEEEVGEPVLPLPRGGARMFIDDGSVIAVTTVHDKDQRTKHTLRLEAGALFTSDVATLRGTTGVFEVLLTSWNSDEEERDTRVKDLFLTVEERPTVYVDIESLTPLDRPLDLGQTAPILAKGFFVFGEVEVPLEMPLTIKREPTAYSFTSAEPVRLSIAEMGRTTYVAPLMRACGGVVKSLSDEVDVSIESLSISWKVGPYTPRIPTRPPELSVKLTGEGAIELVDLGLPEHLDRDLTDDPREGDLRSGLIRYRMPGMDEEEDDDEKSPPFEQR